MQNIPSESVINKTISNVSRSLVENCVIEQNSCKILNRQCKKDMQILNPL